MAGIKITEGAAYNTNEVMYKVDSVSDISLLPTLTEKGKADWCKNDRPSFGSCALVIKTSDVYMLCSDGWVLLG